MRIFRMAIITLVILVIGALVRLDSGARANTPGRNQTESQSGRFPMAVTTNDDTIDSVWY